MENKNVRLTYAKALSAVLSHLNDTMEGNSNALSEHFTVMEIADKLTSLLLQQENKGKSDSSKQTAKEKQTADLREVLYNFMKEKGEALTITDIMAQCETFTPAPGMSTQRVSALMRGLLLANRVEKISEKNKSYFLAV